MCCFSASDRRTILSCRTTTAITTPRVVCAQVLKNLTQLAQESASVGRLVCVRARDVCVRECVGAAACRCLSVCLSCQSVSQ